MEGCDLLHHLFPLITSLMIHPFVNTCCSH
jgi:hypothetical protein